MTINKLLWRRYRKALAVLMAIILGSFVFLTVSQLNSWQQANTYMHSQEFKSSYPEMLKSYETAKQSKHNIAVDKYVERGSNFWLEDGVPHSFSAPNRIRDNSYGQSATFVFVSFVTMLVITLLLADDTAQNFNLFLASSRFSRAKVMLTKIKLLIGLPMLAMLVGEGIYYLITYVTVPAKYYNINQQGLSFVELFTSLTWLGAGLMFLSLTSVLIGKKFGSAIMSSLFFLSIPSLINALTLRSLQYDPDRSAKAPEKVFNWLGNTIPGGCVGLVIAIILAALAIKAFSKLSLERNDKFVMFAKLRWPLWLLIVFYTGFVFYTNGNFGTSSTDMFSGLILLIIWLALIITMYYFIFAPQSWRHPFKSIS